MTEALFRAVFTQAATPMVLVGEAGRIVRANPWFCRFLGHAESDLQRLAFTDLLHPDDRGEHGLVVQRLWGGTIAGHVAENRYQCKDGMTIPGQTHVSVIQSARCLLMVVHEGSDRVDRIETGTARLLAAAGHDLHQPLQTITLFLNVLTSRLEDSRQHDILAKIEMALESWREMLNALLEVSRLEAGLFTVKRESCDLDGLLEQLAADYAPLAAARGLELRRVPCRVRVDSDPFLLERLLRPLLANALQYTDRGRLLVGCRRSKGLVRIEVWDTGIGIAADQLGLVFQPFQRGARHKGLGLGLAIVDSLSRLLDHPVTARSKVGRGSVFGVGVPLPAQGALRNG